MKAKLNFKESMMAGIMAAGASAIMNAILFLIFHASGTITDTMFIQPGQPLTIVPIIISSILPTIIGSFVFFLVEKFSNNGYKIFSIISLVLMAFSFVGPFKGIPGVSMGYAVVLNLMHIVVVGFLLYFIGKNVKKVSA